MHYELSGLPDMVLALPLCTYTCIGSGGPGSVWNASVPVVPKITGLLRHPNPNPNPYPKSESSTINTPPT